MKKLWGFLCVLLPVVSIGAEAKRGLAAITVPKGFMVELVAGPELAQAGDRDDLHGARAAVLGAHGVRPASSRPARTISAVTAGSDINSGAARTLTPSISAVSPSWISQPSRMPVALRAP